MSRFLLALFLLPGLSLLTGPALSQTSPAPAPPICDVKDNIEDVDCLQKAQGLFTRKGDALTIALDGGKSKTYVGNLAACDGDNVDAEKCLVFRMRGYFPQVQSLLVEKAYYECGDFLFVSRRTGSETVMQEVPALSPNGRYLISIDQNDACYRRYDIAIWSMLTDPPTLDFKYEAKQYENWEVTAWTDDDRIGMKAWVNDKTSYDQEAELVRKDGGWILQLGKKTERR